MLTCDIVKADQLPARDEACWREMMSATPAFRSPILSPEFAHAIAAVRDDVHVAIFRKDGTAAGFLAHHRRPGRFARPAGAPFADYSALITFPDTGIKASEALRMAGIDRFQAIGLIDPHNVFGEIGGEEDDAYGIDLSFEINLHNVNKKQTKNINRLRRNLTEAHGGVAFVIGDRDPEHFARMLELKRAQVRLSGLHDFLSPPWVTQLFQHLNASPDSGLHGVLITLMAGDHAVLYHYGLRLGDRIHPWVSSYEPAYGAFSPGQIFLKDCQEPLRAAGVGYYDLSTGQQHYKNSFCNTHFKVRNGRAYGDSASARLSQTLTQLSGRTQKALGHRVEDAFTRLYRRMDQIASLELDLLGRARGVAFALSSAPKRLASPDYA